MHRKCQASGGVVQSYLKVTENFLTASEPKTLFIPKGVAHGYLVQEDSTIVLYGMDHDYCPDCDDGVSGVPILEVFGLNNGEIIMSSRDANLAPFKN